MRRLHPHLLACLTAALACGTPNSGSGPGGKADTPGKNADEVCREQAKGDDEKFQTCRDEAAAAHCEARGNDALRSAQRAFTRDAIRWSCSDVDGVNTAGGDDRGQEYCEYFAVVQLPPEIEGGELPEYTEVGRTGGDGTERLELTDDQLFAMEDQFDADPSAVVGQCVFTSWHQDINVDLPVCEQEGGCPKLTIGDAKKAEWMQSSELGMPLEGRFMRMKVSINSNNAAADLFEKCMTDPPAGDPEDKDDPLHDDYFRGCWESYQLFGTEWRRSDPSVCVAGVRLAECGCGVDTDGDGLADITDLAKIARAVVPPQPTEDGVTLRGFPLGTWSGKAELPAGCRHVETGDGSQTLVACDLTAGDIMSNPDVKQQCREKYGDNVVVHVPVPADAIVCNVPEGGQYTDNCGAMPWVVGDEGVAASICENETEAVSPECSPETCCKVCVNGKACGNSCIAKDSECTSEPGCACDG